MSASTVSISEMRQKMELVVSTYVRLSGCMPSTEELRYELGNEYEPLIDSCYSAGRAGKTA